MAFYAEMVISLSRLSRNPVTITSLALISTSVAADGVWTLARSDCAAIHLARQATENAVCVCPAGDEVAVEYALAAGIRKVHQLEASPVAEFQVAYVGTGGAERVGDIYLAQWAEMSQASLLFDVLRCSEQTDAVRDVECDAGRGARHLLGVRGRLIIVLSPHIARPAYVSRHRRRCAAKQLSTGRTFAHDQPANQIQPRDWSPVRPRVRGLRVQSEASSADDRLNDAFSIRPGDLTESTNVIVADPETCARHIMRYIAHHSFVSRAAPVERLELPGARPVVTEPRSTVLAPQPASMASLGGFMRRRPRQADDSPARRARQPRPFESARRQNHV